MNKWDNLSKFDPKNFKDEFRRSLHSMSNAQLEYEATRPTWKHMEARAELIRRNTPEKFYSEGGMVRKRFNFKVMTEVEFTTADIDCLVKSSEAHYDHTCQALSKTGGLLHLMRAALWPDRKTATYELSMSELDLLCKTASLQLHGDDEVARRDCILG